RARGRRDPRAAPRTGPRAARPARCRRRPRGAVAGPARARRGGGGVTRPTSSPSVRASRVLVQALAAAGVRHVVLAPGSRSAPLAYALAEAARPDAGRDPHAPRIDLHVRVDERAAGFLALGLARGARFDGSDAP